MCEGIAQPQGFRPLWHSINEYNPFIHFRALSLSHISSVSSELLTIIHTKSLNVKHMFQQDFKSLQSTFGLRHFSFSSLRSLWILLFKCTATLGGFAPFVPPERQQIYSLETISNN